MDIIKIEKHRGCQTSILLAILLAVNLLSHFALLPYAQKTANSHMNAGPTFGTLYYALSAVMAVFGISYIFQTRNLRNYLLISALTATLTYW
jgi:hypothetical protein